jgi:hypothetical protein
LASSDAALVEREQPVDVDLDPLEPGGLAVAVGVLAHVLEVDHGGGPSKPVRRGL